MPLTKTGQKIMAKMKSEYGNKKGESVFYATINKGKLNRSLVEEAIKRKHKK